MSTFMPVARILFKRLTLDTDRLQARLARNPREAAHAIGDAAKRSSVAAQLVLGQILLDGRGTPRNPEAALTWFARAAHSGNAEARNMVGRCHEKGWGVPQNYVEAARHFEKATQLGHVWAKVNLAQILMRLGDPADRPRAFNLLREAAHAGNLKAINSVARFLEEGWVGPADPAGAARLYRIAAAKGDHWAQFNLATLLMRADERERAIILFTQAILASDTGFRRRIAPLLLEHPDLDLRRLGLDALARCAVAGDADDQYRYAIALKGGAAGVPDPRQAAPWFRRAADQGHAEAIVRCRRMAVIRDTLRRQIRSILHPGASRIPATPLLQPLR